MDFNILYGIIIVVFAIAGFYALAEVLMHIWRAQTRRSSSRAPGPDISVAGEETEDRCYRDCVERLGNAGRTQCTWVCSAQFGT